MDLSSVEKDLLSTILHKSLSGAIIDIRPSVPYFSEQLTFLFLDEKRYTTLSITYSTESHKIICGVGVLTIDKSLEKLQPLFWGFENEYKIFEDFLLEFIHTPIKDFFIEDDRKLFRLMFKDDNEISVSYLHNNEGFSLQLA